MDTLISLANGFMVVHDPRIDRAKKHNLVDIIMITLCAIMCGMDGWEEIEVFAEKREEWFKKFLELPNGIPSHDTMYRVFSRINPKELNNVLIRWTGSLNKSVAGKVVAIVTIDAAGCQKEIINIIRDKKEADYVIALKGNQPNLYSEVQHFFNIAAQTGNFSTDSFKSIDKGHGRIEQRHCILSPASLVTPVRRLMRFGRIGRLKIHFIGDWI